MDAAAPTKPSSTTHCPPMYRDFLPCFGTILGSMVETSFLDTVRLVLVSPMPAKVTPVVGFMSEGMAVCGEGVSKILVPASGTLVIGWNTGLVYPLGNSVNLSPGITY